MLKALSKAKQDHMENMTPVADYEFETESKSSTSHFAQLQRRITPKQALTSEELQVLVENDELAKLMASISMEMEMEQAEELKALDKTNSDTKVDSPAGEESEANETSESKDTENNSSDTSSEKETIQDDGIVTEKEAKQEQEKDVCEKNDNTSSEG